jgi:beta-N-acetylhexosaminidase
VLAFLAASALASLSTTEAAAANPMISAPSGSPAGQARTDALMHEAIAATLGRMSLEDKVGQLFVTYAYGPTADTADPRNRAEFGVDTPAQVVQRYHLGGVIYFAWTDSVRNPRQIAELSNGLQRAALTSGSQLPLLISTDQEQGIVTRIGPPATQFPGSMALGAGRETEDARTAAAITGRELRAMGVNQDFAPDADVNVNPANPVIGVRSFSADPQLAASMVAAQVEGYQRDDSPARTVSATAKHFPGHGDTSQDSHTALPVVNHTRQQWERLDAPPFRAAIASGVDSIMSAHILTPNIDPSGEPATLSPAILTGILRGELGYDGLIITDSLQMAGVRIKHPDAQIPVLAIEAGADQLLMPHDLGLAIGSVVDAVRSGRLSMDRIDQSVRRVLRVKWNRGVLRQPLVNPCAVDTLVGTADSQGTAQEITDRTVTALRNDAGLLPLRQAPHSVLVTGWGVTTTRVLAERIAARGPTTTALATGLDPTDDDIARAVATASDRNLVVVLTNQLWAPGWGQQRKLLDQLAATSTPVVAVAVRDAYDAAYAESVSTWLATYSNAAVSMESLSRVLFGEVSPAGKLPVSVPAADAPVTTRYPFGYGLTWQ